MCDLSQLGTPREPLLSATDRARGEVLAAQIAHFARLDHATAVLNGLPDPVVVLNAARQVVFGNQCFLRLGAGTDGALLGQRFGEIVGCAFAHRGPDGCGTSPQCGVCGGLRAILRAQRFQLEARGDCIVLLDRWRTLEFEVQATPYNCPLGDFILYHLREVGEKRRREALERTFFHDLLNTASGLYGLAHAWERDEPDPSLPSMAAQLTEELIAEIEGYRTLLEGESGELAVQPGPVSAREALEGIEDLFRHHAVALDRRLEVAYPVEGLHLETDKVLLRRVLINMVKNALEACGPGETATVRARRDGDHTLFEVHNASVMPAEVRFQVFKRSFSTKGRGRGLGTYGMRLLGEQYLHGRVDFDSTPATGTTFHLRLPQVFPVGAESPYRA
jgi:signal transduction histidine kinase